MQSKKNNQQPAGPADSPQPGVPHPEQTSIVKDRAYRYFSSADTGISPARFKKAE